MSLEEHSEEQCERLEAAFKEERDKWSSLMKELILSLRGVDGLAEAQVKMLSYRHILTDKLAEYRNSLASRRSKDGVFKTLRSVHYQTKSDIKYTPTQVNELVSMEMSVRNRKNQVLQNHLDFLSETVSTLDKMGYAIKNRIEMENLRMA